eukprot:Lithocolla_globosa_v1_NODE_483_length_3931_cov_110.479360.p4 type:complete len:114 gc:universal NODE_483_length_3931_cov_110.479360:1724-2065(+)
MLEKQVLRHIRRLARESEVKPSHQNRCNTVAAQSKKFHETHSDAFPEMPKPFSRTWLDQFFYVTKQLRRGKTKTLAPKSYRNSFQYHVTTYGNHEEETMLTDQVEPQQISPTQ